MSTPQDEAPSASEGGAAEPEPAAAEATARAPSASQSLRASTSGNLAAEHDEADPATLALLALRRLGVRARTDFAELRVQYQRLDGAVIVLAVLIVLGAATLHRRLVRAPTVVFEAHGLSLARATTWLPPEPVPPPAPRLAGVVAPAPRGPATELPYRVAFTSAVDSTARLEVLVDKLPAWSNLVTSLELDRRTRWGELYATLSSGVRAIGGHDWLRTSFRYAHAPQKGDQPRVDTAVEYATIDRERLYVVTLRGGARALAELERVTAASLRVTSRSGMPLLPRTRGVGRQALPPAVTAAFAGTVMVIAADLEDGRLVARGGGSGAVIGVDGSVLTNLHVIHDRDGRLHDLFVLGRFVAPERAPELVCAGRPSHAKLERELDLALLKCDLDLDGRRWTPSDDGPWPALAGAGAGAEPAPGARLWVLGYPDVGGGGLTLSQGVVEGYSGEDGSLGRDFLKTDASITHGNSGGPVVDDAGRLLGLAAAFQVRVDVRGGVVEVSKPGLVRPLAAAGRLLNWARGSWVPCAGCSDAALEPTDIEAAAEGVHLSTRILNAANEAPVADASLLVLRAGVVASDVDLNRLGESVIASGTSNADGEVHIRQPVPVPGSYGVIVIAPGYRPLVGDGALVLAADTPSFFDPWGEIRIESE